ncbi:MAG: SHD1 domain-containing protein, partial [Verrucomicrobiota bacterium]
MRKLLGLVLLGVLVTWAASAARAQTPTRTWTSVDGKRTLEAEFVEFKDQKLRLRRSDGKEVSLSLSALSPEDREFVREEMQRRRKTTASATQGKVAKGVAVGEWPRWRGPNIDGKSQETGLLKEWPEQGPPLV